MVRMSPQEYERCREVFEALDCSGYKDLAYDEGARRYANPFQQGKWVNWQNAWSEGQKYLKSGGKSAPEPEPAPTRRIVRASR